MRRAALYWHTLRHLEARQLLNRLWRGIYRPGIQEHVPFTVRRARGEWRTPARREPSMLDEFTFSFLGHERRIESGAWDPRGAPALWRYNLHYFDDYAIPTASETNALREFLRLDRGPHHLERIDHYVADPADALRRNALGAKVLVRIR